MAEVKYRLVDTHCHLDFDGLVNDIDGVLHRSLVAGVVLLQTICTKISDISVLLSLTERYDTVYCSVGNHPLYLQEEGVVSADHILSYCALPKVIGIGETGLDYYRHGYDKRSQIRSFREHIIASQRSGLPLIVHTREADDDTVSIIKEHMQEKKFSGVIHCFTSSKWLAEEMIDVGFYISASGIITFKNAREIQDVFRILPADRILLETDAPFLAPMPFRGKANEPSYLRSTAQFLAELRSISLTEIAHITTDNFLELFSKAKMKLHDASVIM